MDISLREGPVFSRGREVLSTFDADCSRASALDSAVPASGNKRDCDPVMEFRGERVSGRTTSSTSFTDSSKGAVIMVVRPSVVMAGLTAVEGDVN